MTKIVRLLAALSVLALIGAACEIEEVADPGVTPTLGPAPKTGIERNVDPAPTDPATNDPAPTTTAAPEPTTTTVPPGETGPAPTTSAPATTTTAAPPATTTVPPTTTAPTTTAPTTTVPVTIPPPTAGSPIYFNDFAATDSSNRLDQFVAYRDTHVVAHTVGASDHGSTGGVACSAPETTRPQTRDNPYEHVYLCHPGGDPAKGHQMAYAMDASGYVFAGALPDQVFTGVREVRVDVNTTSAGSRNFVEIKVLPANQTFVNALPCGPDIPCSNGWDYDSIGGVGAGTNLISGTGLTINTPTVPDGYVFDSNGATLESGDTMYPLCSGEGHCRKVRIHQGNEDIRTRYEHIFRDNGDGTLSFGIERADGTFAWVTAPGAFPSGDVRVVISFHSYTGTKSGQGPGFCDGTGGGCPSGGNLSPSEGGFTWHWDNLAVFADTSVPSLTYFGGENAEAMATPDGCIAFSQGQRSVPHSSDILPRFECANGGNELVGFSDVAGPSVPMPLGGAADARTIEQAWLAHLAGEHAGFCGLPTDIKITA